MNKTAVNVVLPIFALAMLCLGIVIGHLGVLHEPIRPMVASGPFRPRPPRPPTPPDPPAPPLEENDRRLFDRLRPHLLPLMRERAAAEVQAELMAACDQLERAEVSDIPPDLPQVGEPMQGILGTLLASKIVAFIKKAVYWVVLGVVGAAFIALLKMNWYWLVPSFIAVVSFIAWPAGWAAGKLTHPKA